jgi:transcriptional regulator with XRE-family HTH domain
MSASKEPRAADKHVGMRIRGRRMELNISQTALGDKLGLTFQQVQKYEKGANRVGSSRLVDIADVLKVPVGYFFVGIDRYAGKVSTPDIATAFFAHRSANHLAAAFVKLNPQVQGRIVELTEGLADAIADN